MNKCHYIFKTLLISVSIYSTLTALSQSNEIPNVKLIDAKIKSIELDSTSIGGLILNTTKYIVTSKTKIATKQTFTGIGNTYKKMKVKTAIHYIPDSNNIIRDHIYSHIENYWEEQEKWLRACPGYKDSLELKGDFRYLPINEGFYICSTDTIPFIQTDHGGKGSYVILYFKNQFYKIVPLEPSFLGRGVFLNQNMVFAQNDIEYLITDYASQWMDEIRQILKDK